MLEAAIEQLEALLTVSPHPIGPKLVAALKAFNDGNDVPLNQLMFGTDHYPFPKETKCHASSIAPSARSKRPASQPNPLGPLRSQRSKKPET
jgi:hypothetical protein